MEDLVVDRPLYESLILTESAPYGLWLALVLESVEWHPLAGIGGVVGCQRSLLFRVAILKEGGSHIQSINNPTFLQESLEDFPKQLLI